MFDHLLPFATPVELSCTLKCFDLDEWLDPHFLYGLIRNGLPLDTLPIVNFPGCYATNINVIKFCLDHGLDPNYIDESNKTLFYLILEAFHFKGKYDDSLDEMVAMLLYYGADPSLESCNEYFLHNALDFVFEYSYAKVSDFVFEQLFLYTFDDAHFSKEISLWAFFNLINNLHYIQPSKNNSDIKILLIDELVDFDIEFVVNEDEDCTFFLETLIRRSFYFFELLVERCPQAIGLALETGEMFDLIFDSVSNFIKRMQYLLDSTDHCYFNCVVDFCENADGSFVCKFGSSELEVTWLILFMVEYGMQCTEEMCHVIYRRFGYCVLFRTLLHLGLQQESIPFHPISHCYDKVIMVSFIIDIDLCIETFAALLKKNLWFQRYRFPEWLVTPCGRLLADGAMCLLNFFANAVLTNALLSTPKLPQIVAKKIALLPKVPLLQQLARDASRKYIINKFQVKTSKEFYSLVNALPIGVGYKKIITFEKPLYDVDVSSKDNDCEREKIMRRRHNRSDSEGDDLEYWDLFDDVI
mgnify:CR=1 FL=1